MIQNLSHGGNKSWNLLQYYSLEFKWYIRRQMVIELQQEKTNKKEEEKKSLNFKFDKKI